VPVSRIACITDVHAYVPVLRDALAQIDQLKIDTIVSSSGEGVRRSASKTLLHVAKRSSAETSFPPVGRWIRGVRAGRRRPSMTKGTRSSRRESPWRRRAGRSCELGRTAWYSDAS
jgi:hypothetical protein